VTQRSSAPILPDLSLSPLPNAVPTLTDAIAATTTIATISEQGVAGPWAVTANQPTLYSVSDKPTAHGFEPWKDRFAQGLLLVDSGREVLLFLMRLLPCLS